MILAQTEAYAFKALVGATCKCLENPRVVGCIRDDLIFCWRLERNVLCAARYTCDVYMSQQGSWECTLIVLGG